MSDSVKEQLSAFLDGELVDAETTLLLRRVEKDSELVTTASRYLLIGEALRVRSQTAIVSASRGFADRVRATIAQDQEPPAVVKGAPRAARAATARWLKMSGSLAIAASVGAAAVLLIQAPSNSGQQQTVVANSTTVEPAALRVVDDHRNADAGIREVPAAAARLDAIPDSRLTRYVVEHSEYSSPLGRRNVLTGILAEDSDLQDVSFTSPHVDAPH